MDLLGRENVNKFEAVSKTHPQMKTRGKESASKCSFGFNDEQESESSKICI